MIDRPVEAPSNVPELSVGELSNQIGRTLKSAFGRIRVRGEVTRATDHRSGHLYLTLTDDQATIDAVCWRGSRRKLSVQPEDGMEVICTGSISTYAPRSKYQLIIEQVEMAGEGALLKLLEDRRRKLLAEGLFDAECKKPLPFMPAVIGVVTSPTGSVIRDILHRLSDRFPVRVVVWPVLVQGTGANRQIAAAIDGFNRLSGSESDPVMRPDVIIVARGGGSLEDLWPFNEEDVVRAAAASAIPLISAVGHETDTTLIDFAADRRAPTPTAAAEFAVPVRNELVSQVADLDLRLSNAVSRLTSMHRERLGGLSRGLGDPEVLIESRLQHVNFLEQRLDSALPNILDQQTIRVARQADRLPRPEVRLTALSGALALYAQRLLASGQSRIDRRQADLGQLTVRLQLEPIVRTIRQSNFEIESAGRRLSSCVDRRLADFSGRFDGLARLLQAASYERTLERGFVLVRDMSGKVINRVAQARSGEAVSLRFSDGETRAVIGAGRRRTSDTVTGQTENQGDLF